MRLLSLHFALLALTLAVPVAAHADPIDDFSLVGNGHTITYSLPATSSFPDFSLFNFFGETAATTIDGVAGYSENGAYYDTYFFPYVSLILNVPASVSTANALYLKGSTFISFAFVPAVNPPPYFQEDVVPTFIPGTYTLQDLGPQLHSPPVTYTLTITQETATAVTPEPSTLTLLGTAALSVVGVLGMARRRSPRKAGLASVRPI